MDTTTWKEFEANEITHSAAHHLQAIDEAGRDYGGWARVSDIARKLSVTRGSVSINLRSLTARGLVEQGEHHLVRLTPKGAQIVKAIHAKNAILRTFFREVLHADEERAEIDSCKIEHLVSNATARQLLRFLHFFLSSDPTAHDALREFHQFEDKCSSPATCPVCSAAAQAAGNEREAVCLVNQL
jgi:Mn-dependent DtxR family transcriptional regulator